MRIGTLACSITLLSGLTLSAAALSPVADAAAKGDRVALRNLISKADVNAPQADGATALQWAAYRNDLEMADLLIAAKANVHAANREGATPLYLAALNGSASMIERLLKAGADPNERQPKGETPLMLSARNGNLDAIRVLLKAKADVNAKETVRGTTALMWAAEQGHADAVKLLIDSGANVSAASNPDTKGAKAYLAPTLQARLNSAQGAGTLRQQGLGAATPGRAPAGRAGAPGAGRAGRPAAAGAAGAKEEEDEDVVAKADAAAAQLSFGRQTDTDGGGLTPLVFAARENCLECVKELLAAGADVNQTTHYGYTALLTAVKNNFYKTAAYLLEKGANPNIANKGGWTPLYIATDNRNIEIGDYPVRPSDMDQFEFIKMLVDHGANVNQRNCGVQSTPEKCVGDSTETRTNFTMQWLLEDGATPFLRASQSSDVELMKYLLSKGADPKITTANNVTALAVASGIGWVEGVTFEWSPEENMEAVKMLLDLGLDPNVADVEGRTALHGAAHKGRNEIVKLLVEHGANLEAHDKGSRDTVNGAMKGMTWIPLHYAEGLVRVGVQSALPHPETAALIKQMMADKGMTIPPDITSSICLTKGLNGCQ